MTRFFVTEDELRQDEIILTGENAAHGKVLRLKAGEQVSLCDGLGSECVCTIREIGDKEIVVDVQHRQSSISEARVSVSVYIAFPKGDKLEHVIQKATELGANEIVAFPSARCISKPDDKSLRKKLERWQKIAASAAEQSGRGRIPQVLALSSYQEALKRSLTNEQSILFYENEAAVTLHMALENTQAKTISLITGPEGGLEVREVMQAKDAGVQICTLGKRILRCETAPLCALSAVMYAFGEF